MWALLDIGRPASIGLEALSAWRYDSADGQPG